MADHGTNSVHVLLVFVDGLGLGEDNPDTNPLARAHLPHLAELLDGHRLVAQGTCLDTGMAALISADATLGVDGLPQSATGQTTLLTGVNAAQQLGYHWGPHLNEPLRHIIRRASIFKTLASRGRRLAFANAYPERYFAEVDRGKRGLSPTGLAARAGGVRLRDHDDLCRGQAVSAFFTNQGWRDVLGYTDVPDITLHQAGRNLAALACQHDFTLFEHYYTDICGHHQDWDQALFALESLDAFIGGVLDGCTDDILLILTSDHGNLEDMTVRGHTRNPVPVLLVGKQRRRLAVRIKTLADLAPAVVDMLS